MATKSGLQAGTITTISNHVSHQPPAVSAFRGVLFQAHMGTKDDRLYCYGMGGAKDPFEWRNYDVPSGFKSNAAPSLASFTDSLFMAWKGKGNNKEVYYSQMHIETDWEHYKKEMEQHGAEWDGKPDEWKEKKWEEKKQEWKSVKKGWRNQKKVERSHVRTSLAPVIVNYPTKEHEQRLFLFFINESGSNDVGAMGWTQLETEGEGDKKDTWGQVWYPPAKITIKSNFAPSVAHVGEDLYIAWLSEDNHVMTTRMFRAKDGSGRVIEFIDVNPTKPKTEYAKSDTPPSIFNNKGLPTLVWKSNKAGQTFSSTLINNQWTEPSPIFPPGKSFPNKTAVPHFIDKFKVQIFKYF